MEKENVVFFFFLGLLEMLSLMHTCIVVNYKLQNIWKKKCSLIYDGTPIK
jgi:hypothetical protein